MGDGLVSQQSQDSLFLKHNELNIFVFPTEKNIGLFRVLRLFAKDNYFW